MKNKNDDSFILDFDETLESENISMISWFSLIGMFLLCLPLALIGIFIFPILLIIERRTVKIN